MELIEEKDNKTQVLRDMVSLTNDVVDNLKKKTRKVSKQKLRKTGLIRLKIASVVEKKWP